MTDAPRFSNPPDMPTGKSFWLDGITLDGNPWEEEFHSVGVVPQGALADLAVAIEIKDGSIIYGQLPCVRFIRASLAPGEEERFDKLIRDKARPVHIDVLGAAMMFIAGIVTDRPTGPLPSSQPGERPVEDGSEDDGSSPDTEPPTLIASTLTSTST